MLFRLKGGNHVEDDVTYKSGDIIDSPRDLVAMFRGKFERAFDKELEAKSTKGTKDKTVPSKPAIPPVSEADGKADKTKPEASPIIKEGEYGRDVTAEFPTAEELDVMVFEKSKWYTVVDNEDNKVLNEKKLRAKEVQPFLDSYLEDDED